MLSTTSLQDVQYNVLKLHSAVNNYATQQTWKPDVVDQMSDAEDEFL